MEIRRINDIDRLMQWRREVIENVFGAEPDTELLRANEAYYRIHIADGTHIAVEAVDNGRETGCGAICLTDELPSPDNPSGKCAYLMNIYVRKPYRCHGIAHAIVSHLVRIAKEKNCGKIYLEATEEGRSVYAALGFKDMEGMMKLE